ncbi:type II 3-dehydroquinate dehydratase [Arthrobacter sp. NPDC056493]|uniref:type II 3-dehydroquinate dehydratase n=1 Tax=Arthrobacter sp. NPDC056493 TaxID=3345839 RepID=UPI0036726EEC
MSTPRPRGWAPRFSTSSPTTREPWWSGSTNTAKALDAVILNPAGLTPYGRPLLDALLDTDLPVAVVHISQLYRHYGDDTADLFRATADVYVCGLGWRGYSASLERLNELREAQMLREAVQIAS